MFYMGLGWWDDKAVGDHAMQYDTVLHGLRVDTILYGLRVDIV